MLAVTTKKIALSGPYTLTQGGLGLIARNPIFLTDLQGRENFWGFSVIILDLPEALEPLLLGELTQDGYAYRLHCVMEDGKDVTIGAQGKLPRENWIGYEIQVPNHRWTLDIAPERGWIRWRRIGAELLLGILISMLCGIISFQRTEKARVLHRFATTDELTGLFNRRWLGDMMDSMCRNREQPFTLIYMDLNGFKGINDTLGHSWGDVLLRDVSRRIQAALGNNAVLARVGGDEFVAILSGGEDEQAAVRRIREGMAEPFVLDGMPRTLSVSIGSAAFPAEGLEYDALIRIADGRMYSDKRETGGRTGRM